MAELDRITVAPKDGPGKCVNCRQPANDHEHFDNVQMQSRDFCPVQTFYVNTDEVLDAVKAVERVVMEAARRVGGFRADGTLPPHFTGDVAIAIWDALHRNDGSTWEYEEDLG